MRPFRWMILALLMLFPFTTLFHRNDSGEWDTSRGAMAMPDEFSYLLVADSILHGHGLALKPQTGVESFYPPGFPLFLAGWGVIFGLTAFTAHVLNAVFLSVSVPLVYLVCRKLWCGGPWLALLATGIYITNWHIIEGTLMTLSEPAFMVFTMVWLVLALRWPRWHENIAQSSVIAALAVVCWSIRSAGIVCILTTLALPFLTLFRPETPRSSIARHLPAVIFVIFFAAVFRLGLHRYADQSSHSYTAQLINGLTHGGQYSLHEPFNFLWFNLKSAAGHMNDFAASFTRWVRDQDAIPYDRSILSKDDPTGALYPIHLIVIRWSFVVLALIGFICRVRTWRRSRTLFLEVYVAFYIAMYLIWPFKMIRFWAPILPIMLVYAALAVFGFWRWARIKPVPAIVALFSLLLVLNIQEITLQLHFYQRRLNFVSDAIAGGAAKLAHDYPDPAKLSIAMLGEDNVLMFDWYLRPYPGYRAVGPPPPPAAHPIEQMLVEQMLAAEKDRERRIAVVCYFKDDGDLFNEVLANLKREQAELMGRFTVRRIYQKSDLKGWDRVAIWELVLRQ